MADVAQRAGVSRALVSIVFRGAPGASADSRARVLRAAEELGYRPDHRARLLGRGRSHTVGVVFGLRDEFHGGLVEALYAEAGQRGWDLALGATAPSRSEAEAVHSLLEQRCEALVLLGPALARKELEAVADQVPLVVAARRVARRAAGPAYDVVRTDDVAGARLAVDHLVALGHRRIAHADGRDAPGAAERRRGYQQAMEAAGLASAVHALDGGPDETAGERSAEQLLRIPRRRRPTAVVAFNDHCAVGLLAALRGAGSRVPQDLSVVGYDDSRVAALSSVDLTTVRQDASRLAQDALGLALERVDDPSRVGREIVVPPALVPRSTTAAVA
ncbi:LacI family DNA-binding transcriptional regulator [Nocardioides marmoribigeumensis]